MMVKRRILIKIWGMTLGNN